MLPFGCSRPRGRLTSPISSPRHHGLPEKHTFAPFFRAFHRQLASTYLNVDIGTSGPPFCDDDFDRRRVVIKEDEEIFPETEGFGSLTYGQLLENVSALLKLHIINAHNPTSEKEMGQRCASAAGSCCWF